MQERYARIIAFDFFADTISRMAKPGDIIDVKEAAKLLGVKHRQALNLINDGVLPATRMGRFFVIRRADLKVVPKVRKPGPKRKV